MTFNGLKQITYQSIIQQKFSTTDEQKLHVNQILTGVLLFKTLQNLMNSSNKYQDDIKPTAFQYATTFKNIAESLEKKYVSYKQIYNKILSYKILSFLSISINQINEIFSLYQDKTELIDFSLNNFSTRMYNLGNINEIAYNRLSRIHYKIMVPIVEYYMTYHNISLEDVTVEDVGNTPAHQIKISIAGINSNQIYSDIKRNTMDIQKYIGSANITSDGFVSLLIK